jgi:predicted ATPase
MRAFAREFVNLASRVPVGRGSAEPLATDELEQRFRLSPKLYGRDDTLRQLRARVSTMHPSPSIAFIDGEAGMGKTALLRRLQDTRLDPDVHVGVGRFHQGAPTPLSGWVTALGDLAAGLLTKDRAELDRWRSDLVIALGEWAPLISALVPQWQAVLRCSRPSPSENPDASINRLALAIHRLLGAFADVDTAVVLLLDDLQWADASSLRILELVLTAPEPVNLLVIATTRSGDGTCVDGSVHALRDRLAAADVSIEVCVLAPLRTDHIRALIEDSCEGVVEDVASLSEVVLARTAGSPLFVREFIAALVRKKVLRRAEGRSAWRWSAKEIQALPLAEDLVTLVANKIGDLSRDLQETLRLSSCLGTEFSLRDFCAIYAVEPDLAANHLERATTLGLLRSRVGDGSGRRHAAWNPGAATAADAAPEVAYEFVHDRVLEACEALNSDAERASLHLHIGRVLARRLANDADPGQEVYRIARHFNAARHLITSDPALRAVEPAGWHDGQGARRLQPGARLPAHGAGLPRLHAARAGRARGGGVVATVRADPGVAFQHG